jgi:hypothetical protein
VKRIYYSSGSVLTGDFIADAIVDLAVFVSSRSASASVDIPVVLPDGSTGQAHLLISPVSSLLTVSESAMAIDSGQWDDEVAGAAVRGVRAQIESLTNTPRAQTVRDGEPPTFLSDFDGY